MSSPHPARRFSDPNGSGPGRFLAVARALSDELAEDKIEFPLWNRERIKKIHEEAKTVSHDERRIGPLEQYILLNSAMRDEAKLLRKRIKDFHVVFVTGVSTDILAVKEKPGVDRKVIRPEEIASPKMGFSFYSDSNQFSTRLMQLEETIEGLCSITDKKVFPRIREKPNLYVVVGPFVAMGYLNNGRFRDLLLDDLVEGEFTTNICDTVNAALDQKGKAQLGAMEKSVAPEFRENAYMFSETFFNGQKAAATMRLPEGVSPSMFRNQCSLNTFYNRLIASYMYKAVLGLVQHQRQFLVFASQSSYAFSIMERAIDMAGKNMLKMSVMEGAYIPLDGEANRSAMNKVGGYLYGEAVGRRTSLSINDFFGRK
jgi:hypothetical protein